MDPSSKTTNMFLVTANIASCFDQPKVMLNPWLDELFKVIKERSPQFIALHCQEVGGKNYETSMDYVEDFIRNLLRRTTEMDYNRSRIYIDSDYTSAEKFTALGNIYFIRSDVDDIQIWDFEERKFVECDGKEEHVGCIESVSTKQKSKFPQEFFPECKWSRKGFLRTRWCVNGTQLDLVNIHLFHDASNFVAMENFPSSYTLNRKRAIEHTLDRFHNDNLDNVPLFLFGDFNFRVDTKGVVEKLTVGCSVDDTEVSGESTRLFRDVDDNLLLSVSKKSFDHRNHSSVFMKENGLWLRPFDRELEQFNSRLYEFPITFPPSYPFEEGIESQDGKLYMKTRCPSWCDRIILSRNAKCLVEKSSAEIKYNIIGLETRMGDHKPVGLCVQTPVGEGIVGCCSPAIMPCPNFVHVPSASCFTFGAWCKCHSYPVCQDATDNSSVCSIPSSFEPLPLPTCPVVIPDLLEAITCDSIDKVLQLKPCHDHTDRQHHPCVCSSNVSSEELLSDNKSMNDNAVAVYSFKETDILLKNLLKLNEFIPLDKMDSNLKRVHSDPIKAKLHYDRLKKSQHQFIRSGLVHSQSLGGERKGYHGSKFRLRATSSRLVSHHSSSSEEWYEEIPPSPKNERESDSQSSRSKKELGEGDISHLETEKEPREAEHSKISNHSSPGSNHNQMNNKHLQSGFKSRASCYSEDDSLSTTDSILQTPKLLKQESSLNNFLLTDKSQCHLDNKSQSAQSDQTDDGVTSFTVNSISSIGMAQCPCKNNKQIINNDGNTVIGSSQIIHTAADPITRLYPEDPKFLGSKDGRLEEKSHECCCSVS